MSTPSTTHPTSNYPVTLPRIEIHWCQQCRWMLRAAYYAQELFSTFGPSIGELALIPTTGGIFTINLLHIPQSSSSSSPTSQKPEKTIIWDRKSDSGFPETKILKQRIRDLIEPSKDLGHSDSKDKPHSASKDGHNRLDKKSSAVPVVVQKPPTPLPHPPQDPPHEPRPEGEGAEAFTSVDLTAAEAVRRKGDGSVCEECGDLEGAMGV